jgi:hypothetical protein
MNSATGVPLPAHEAVEGDADVVRDLLHGGEGVGELCVALGEDGSTHGAVVTDELIRDRLDAFLTELGEVRPPLPVWMTRPSAFFASCVEDRVDRLARGSTLRFGASGTTASMISGTRIPFRLPRKTCSIACFVVTVLPPVLVGGRLMRPLTTEHQWRCPLRQHSERGISAQHWSAGPVGDLRRAA